MENESIVELIILISLVLFLVIISIWRMKNKNHQTEEYNSKKSFYMKVSGYGILLIISMIFELLVLIFNFIPSNADSARYMISAFIQSEAAILSIVITLSLFVVQQSSSSYSPRVVELFKDIKKNPDFSILIVIYIGVMLYSALVLKAINDDFTVIKTIENELFSIEIIKTNISHATIQALIWLTYFLALFAFLSLVLYVKHTIDLLNPSNIISMLSEEITLNLKSAYLGNHSKGNPRDGIDNDPIVPLIDIVRGSLMIYDYETVRNGLRAIESRVISIIEKENFENKLIKSMYETIFSHFERIGQLAVVREDYHSAKIIIIILYNFIDKILEKEKVNPQAEFAIKVGISSLEVIGTTASKKKMEIVVIEVSELVRKINKLAVKKELKKIALCACEVETNLRPYFDDAWINKSYVLLHFHHESLALKAVEEALKIEESYDACMQQSFVYKELGNEQGSSNAYDKAMAIQYFKQQDDDLHKQY